MVRCRRWLFFLNCCIWHWLLGCIETHSYLPYQLDIRPSQEFSPSGAKSKLAALEISATHEKRMQFLVPHGGIIGPEEMEAEAMGFTLQEGRLLYMSSSVDMENAVTIGCAGAVLTYLQRRRATDTIPGKVASDLLKVKSVKMFGLKDTMWVLGTTRLYLVLRVKCTDSVTGS